MGNSTSSETPDYTPLGNKTTADDIIDAAASVAQCRDWDAMAWMKQSGMEKWLRDPSNLSLDTCGGLYCIWDPEVKVEEASPHIIGALEARGLILAKCGASFRLHTKCRAQDRPNATDRLDDAFVVNAWCDFQVQKCVAKLLEIGDNLEWSDWNYLPPNTATIHVGFVPDNLLFLCVQIDKFIKRWLQEHVGIDGLTVHLSPTGQIWLHAHRRCPK